MIRINCTEDLLYEVFDNQGELVYSMTHSSVADLTTPINSLSGYFSVRISTVGEITSLTRLSDEYNPITVAIIANTPSLTSLSGFQQNCPNLVGCQFQCTLNNLLTMAEAFIDSGLESITLPDSLPSLISMHGTFARTKISTLDLSNTNLPLLEDCTQLVDGCVYLNTLKFPASMPELTTTLMAARDTIRLIDLVMPTSIPKIDSFHYFLEKSGFETDIEFPDIPANLTNLYSTLNGASQVKRVKFNGGHSSLYFQNTFRDMPSLEYIEMPRTTGTASSGVFNSGTNSLKTYVGPDVGYINLPLSNLLESITGDHDTSMATSYPSVIFYSYGRNTLHTFNCPKLRVQKLQLGYKYSSYKMKALKTAEIDWANSTFASTSSPQLCLNADMDGTELNRIMTALPTVTGKTMHISYCTGYADCDPTIATAKGWTVL